MKQKKKKRVFRVCTSGCHSYISYVDMWDVGLSHIYGFGFSKRKEKIHSVC